MKPRIKIRTLITGIVCLLVTGVFLYGKPVSATASTNYNSEVVKKALLTGVHRCYTNNAISGQVPNISGFTNFGSQIIGGDSGSYIALPSGLTNIKDNNISCKGLFLGDETALFSEEGTFEGVFKLAGISSTATNKDAKINLLQGMGYQQVNNSGNNNERCIAFNYNETSSGVTKSVTTDQICAKVDSNQKITSLSTNLSTATYLYKGMTNTMGAVPFLQVTSDGKVELVRGKKEVWEHGYLIRTDRVITTAGVGSTWEELKNDLRTTLSAAGQFTYSINLYGTNISMSYAFTGNSTADNYEEDTVGDVGFEIKNSNFSGAANSAIRFLSNGSLSYGTLKFSAADKIALLISSLKEYFYEGVGDVSSFWICGVSDWTDYGAFPASHAINVSPSGTVTPDCRINPSAVKKTGTIHGFNGDYFSSNGSTKLTLEQTIQEINKLSGDMLLSDKAKCNQAANNARERAGRILDMAIMGQTSKENGDRAQATLDSLDTIKRDHGEYWYEENGTIMCYEFIGLDGNVVDTPTDSTNPPNTDDGNNDNSSNGDSSTLAACYDAAGVLGWIVCPVTQFLGDATSGLYEWIKKDFLVIDSSLVTGDGTHDGIRSGWSQFRNFANIIFIIAFIIVILSQLTGIGISNYNIKKILPRLIMVVVLVNLSFVICQLAVDISNILGNGLEKLFIGMAENIRGESDVFDYGSAVSAVIDNLMATVTTGGTLIIAGVTIAMTGIWKIWLLPFLLALLSTAIGILFFFVILGVRKAGVVILIALAPIAIVCYALPNTKSFYDKWQKMFVALLMVYPICGLLIGGGKFASTLLLQAGGSGAGFFYTLVAMLLSVMPFFMVPSIVKGSMAMMGNLGMKISSLGSRMGAGLTRTVRNSEMGRNYQRQQQMSYDLRTAKRLEGKIKRREDAGKGVSNGLRRRAYLHRSAADRVAYEDARADGMSGGGALEPGTPRWNALTQSFRQEQLAQDTKAQRSLYESEMNVGDIEEVGEKYEAQLEELQKDPTNRDALVRVRALQDILSESDAGRGEVQSRMLSIANKYQSEYESDAAKTQDTALSMAAGHLMANYQGVYKKANRGAWSMLGRFQGKDFGQLFRNGGVTEVETRDENGNIKKTSYRSDFYDRAGLSGYDASTLPAADESALVGINRGIEDGKITGRERAGIVGLAGESYGNETVYFQPKVADQIRKTIIGGSTKATIGGVNAKALSRLAEDVRQGTIANDDRNKLVTMAREALEGDHVTGSAQAKALNEVLRAAGESPVRLRGNLDVHEDGGSDRFDVRGTSGDSDGSRRSRISLPSDTPTPEEQRHEDEFRRQMDERGRRDNNDRMMGGGSSS